MKPEWAKQIPDGVYDVRVGDSDGFIRCDSYLEYFLGDGTYQTRRNLNNVKTVDLSVFTLDANASDQIADEIQSRRIFSDCVENTNDQFILDIDLDFFSTENPFRKMLQFCGTYELLKPIFRGNFFQHSFDKDANEDELLAFAVQRSHYIDSLENVFNQLAQGVSAENLLFNECLNPVKERVLSLITHIKQTNESSAIQWKMYFNAGCTLDSNELPIHVSTPNEIIELIELFKKFLLHLNTTPTLITISRSSEDGYCPLDQVERIQEEVLKVLVEIYGKKLADKPILQYKDEEWCL